MLAWKDGQPYSDRFADVYFSIDSGIEETRHVFLRGNRLDDRFRGLAERECFCIGETGFGTGLNFLCAWQLFAQVAPAGASLDFFSVEKFPLSDDELRAALTLWPDLSAQAAPLLARWRRRVPGWNRWSLAGGRVRLTVAMGDVEDALPQLPSCAVDAWFLDGFAPARNPDMWNATVLTHVARASRIGTTFATYTSAGWVRRGMQQAGFTAERTPGFGRKRQMLSGTHVPREQPSATATAGAIARGAARPRSPRSALVIGGGIAGCTAAHALAQRGIAVTLIERAARLATAASGNPRGILHARFGATVSRMYGFVLAAYGHALALYDDVLPVDGVARGECGLLHLAFSQVERTRIARFAELEWPDHLLSIVDAGEASRRAGIEMVDGGLWFPAGGWITPSTLSANLVAQAGIAQRLGHEARTLERTAGGWRASGRDAQGGAWDAEAEVVLVCCAHSATQLAQLAHLPLTPVRGQITLVPESAASGALHCVVCGDGYFAPAADGVHVIGATHTFNDESVELRSSDHAQNLERLAAYAPTLHRALGEIEVEHLGGRASVRCSAPGAMPRVGSVEQGLYCSLAHGTRGLITAGLAAEVVAAEICGQLPPLPTAILAALAPGASGPRRHRPAVRRRTP